MCWRDPDPSTFPDIKNLSKGSDVIISKKRILRSVVTGLTSISLVAGSLMVAQPANADVWTSCIEAAAKILQWFSPVDTAAHGGTPDGRISWNDIRASAVSGALAGVAVSERPFLQGAAQHLARHNGYQFSRIDSINAAGRRDGIANERDFRTYISNIRTC
jgi:hypothetical protein